MNSTTPTTPTGAPPSNFRAFTLLALTIASLAYQSIAKDFSDAGLPGAAKYIVLVGGICAAIGLAYSEAIRRNNGPIPPGTTTTTVSTTKTPPTAARVAVALLGIMLGLPAGALVVGSVAAVTATEGCNASVPPVTPAEVISIEGDACLIDELADPLLPSGTATVIATFIQNACSKDIPQTLTTFVAQLIEELSSTPTVADGSVGAAPISTLDRIRDHFGVPRVKVTK
jgi:hypothetical protein